MYEYLHTPPKKYATSVNQWALDCVLGKATIYLFYAAIDTDGAKNRQ
jgi:hypothetical protein